MDTSNQKIAKLLQQLNGTQNPDWANMASQMVGGTFEVKAFPKAIQGMDEIAKLVKNATSGEESQLGNIYDLLKRYKSAINKDMIGQFGVDYGDNPPEEYLRQLSGGDRKSPLLRKHLRAAPDLERDPEGANMAPNDVFSQIILSHPVISGAFKDLVRLAKQIKR